MHRQPPSPSRSPSGRLADVLAPMSFGLDLAQGQPEGHAVRTCMIAARIGEELDLHPDDRCALFYAALLKDLGGTSIAGRMCELFGADERAVKRDLRLLDWHRRGSLVRFVSRWTQPDASGRRRLVKAARLSMGARETIRELIKVRAERGADLAASLHLPGDAAHAIRSLDEHWDGGGFPEGRSGRDIPLLARIVCLAQTAEVFAQADGAEGAFRIASARSGSWFDPEVAKAFLATRADTPFWARLHDPMVVQFAVEHEPGARTIGADPDALDRVAYCFAQVVDTKSAWTVRHSLGVSEIAVALASFMGMPAEELRRIRHAALLHDVGKLAISNRILDKPGKLTSAERGEMKLHPAHTMRILERTGAFAGVAEMAASHHERLDGRGYYRGLVAEQLDRPARILIVADMFEALAATRPYRPDKNDREVLNILKRYSGTAICPEVFGALRTLYTRGSIQITPRNAAA